ncbi:MAG: HD domain-containing protein, partial [Candidatus Latescibacteria bacterium]|nr:HD domain-containing protein [Candidatus Latescibacterota bacterium]
PGARHSRFEHSLGVFHLAKRFLTKVLQSTPPLVLGEEDVKVFLAAALLHDIGHYPFSHLLEEMPLFFGPHEHRGRTVIERQEGAIYEVLSEELGVNPARVANAIDYRTMERDIPETDLLLANILSGTLDPDKIDYLLRDALYCGVPFGGSVNKDRLINSIKFDPVRKRLAITHKGIDAVEALIFTNYLMYRNVYWHHTVRAASTMFKRAIEDLLVEPGCRLTPNDFEGVSENEMLTIVEAEVRRLHVDRAEWLLNNVAKRRLYKVARIFYPHEKRQAFVHYFYDLYHNPTRRRAKEVELCRVFSQKVGVPLAGHEILIDIPKFDKSPEIDLKVFFGAAIPVDRDDPLSFDDPEVTVLTTSLTDNFETHAKIFRIFCIDNDELREALKRDVKKYMV